MSEILTRNDVSLLRCVVVLRRDLPGWVAANTAALLAMTLAARLPDLVGSSVEDAFGQTHPGMAQLPVTILGTDHTDLQHVRERLLGTSEIVAEFTRTALEARTYAEYARQLAQTAPSEIDYLGVGVLGDQKVVRRVTKGLRLYEGANPGLSGQPQ